MAEVRPVSRRRLLLSFVLGSVALVLAGCALSVTVSVTQGPLIQRSVTIPPGFGGGTVAVEDLPPEAATTLRLIDEGGPFPYDQDGAVFQNREGILPAHPRGYYHEYTVETPGSPDRGARRIITGDAGERYYTNDHYESFALIVADGGG